MRTSLTLPLLLLAAAPAFAQDPLVVMAASRGGSIEFFDATLGPLGAIGVNQLLESVTASPDGRRLYIAQENPSGGCCGLFSLELETRAMCLLTAPALFGTPSPDGRFLFAQGSHGVDVFDARTLNRIPTTMKAPGAYNLQPSPDGRWLLGVTNSPKPSLDIFDMKSRVLARQLPMPAGPVTGAWAGDRFYLFNYSSDVVPETGWVWSVRPEDGQLTSEGAISLPDLHGACNQPVLLMLVGAPDKLFLAEAFGFKVDRRQACPDLPLGGIYAIPLSRGHVSKIAGSVHVNRMVVSPDGRDLYVLQSTWRNRRREAGLLRIDIRTGLVTNSTLLERGDWNLAVARIPPALIPRGNQRAFTLCSR